MTISVNISRRPIGNKTSFSRYSISTVETPHRHPIPHPFVPQVRKVGLAKILISEMLEYNFKLIKSSYRKTLMSRPCIYGVFNSRFGGFTPIQDKCTGCMRCVEEYPEVCRVDRNPEFTHFSDSYWTAEGPTKVSDSPFTTIWYEARTGKIQIRGMGYKGFFGKDGWDAMWTDMSEIVRPTRDGVYGREFISTQIDIGKRCGRVTIPIQTRTSKQIFSLPLPIFFDFLPDNIMSKSIAESIVIAVEKSRTACIFTPEQLDRYNLSIENGLMLYVTSDNFTKIGTHVNNASVIILDRSSWKLLSRLRSINRKVPVLLRLPYDEETEVDIREGIENDVDGFLLYSDYHGLDASGTKYIKELIGSVHSNLVRDGSRDQITLLTSGGIILAEHIPKAIIMGADGIGINTSALVALQVKFSGECRIPEESTFNDTFFKSSWGGQRLINLLGSWHNQLIEIMSAMGIKEVRRLRGDTGRAMFENELEEAAFGDIERID